MLEQRKARTRRIKSPARKNRRGIKSQRDPARQVTGHLRACKAGKGSLPRARSPKNPCGFFRGPRRAGGPLAVERVFIASLLREVPRLAAAEGVFFSVVALALSLSPLTPSVAFGASSLGEGAFRDGGSGPRGGRLTGVPPQRVTQTEKRPGRIGRFRPEGENEYTPPSERKKPPILTGRLLEKERL